MKKLKVFFRKSGLGDVEVAVFSTEDCGGHGYNFLINKDFEINSTEKRIFAYYLDLTNKKILNLKHFKMEISD